MAYRITKNFIYKAAFSYVDNLLIEIIGIHAKEFFSKQAKSLVKLED